MVYIVDYENVTMHGFKGHTTLDPDDEVIVFISPHSQKTDISTLIDSKASFRFVGIEPNGRKNYMDFQIVAMCSKLIFEHKKVAIVSNDCGYEAVRDFFRNCALLEENSDIKLVSNLQCDPVVKPDKQTAPLTNQNHMGGSKPSNGNSSDDNLLKELESVSSVKEIIERLPITDVHKQALHNLTYRATEKKKKMTKKEFLQRCNFLPLAAKTLCIDAILPHLNLK